MLSVIENYGNAVEYWARQNGHEPSSATGVEHLGTYIAFQVYFFDDEKGEARTEDKERFKTWLVDQPRINAKKDDKMHSITPKNLLASIGAAAPAGECALEECSNGASTYVFDKEPWAVVQFCTDHADADRDLSEIVLEDNLDAGTCLSCREAQFERQVRNQVVEYECANCGYTKPVMNTGRV